MDKKNSRTDLLAAGRKKLQQYRQKKDGKGSSSQGKSSKRSNKSEQHESDADAASSAAKQTVSSQVPEGETAAVDLSVSQSMESSLPSGLDAAAGVSSVEPIASETGNAEIILASNDGLPIEVVTHGDGDVDSSGPNGGESTRAVDSEPSTEIPSSTADIPVLEGDTKHDNAPDPSTLVDTIEGTVPDMSLSQTRGDPVTDEADGLGLNQFDRGNETELEVDGRLAFSAHERAEHLEGATLEVTNMEGPSREAEQAICDDASLSILEANSSQTDGSLAESTQMTNKQVEDVAPCSPVEDDKEMCSMSGDCGDDKTVKENQQNLPKGPFVSQDESHETSLQRNGELLSDLTLSIPRDGSPVRLSQLVEVIRALNEDEYKLLLNSQEVVSVANVGKDGLAPSCHPDLFEKLREELYLTAFMKDVFYLQLSEQTDLQIESDRHCHQLIDEISVLHSSLNEIQNGNAHLEEELAQCRSELLVFASGREELQNQFHTALAQAEEFSTRANELQSSLVRSQEDLSGLLSELADYKSQVAALQVDNENMNGTLHSLTEERKKIVEEKESSLHENENLSMELTRCKDLLVTLREEIEQLNVTIASLTEEKKIFMDEKLLSLHENEKLQTELADCKAMFASLQVDHSEISKNLALMTEEKMKLEEEKESLEHEKKKADLGSKVVELTEVQEQLDALQLQHEVEILTLKESLRHAEEALISVRCELQEKISELEQSEQRVSSLTEEKKIFMDAKLFSLQENEKLQTELADCKAMFASLQVDHSEISKNLALMTEEKMKLEEEKEFLEHEKKKADLGSKVVELTEVQEQLHALQLQHEVEILTLKESLRHAEEALISVRCELQEKISELKQSEQRVSSLTEEKKIFMDAKLLSLHENEKLQTELADCKAMFASLQVDHSDISKNLALMTEEKMKLEKEKEFLEHEKKKADLVFNIHQFGSKVVELTEVQEQLDALQLQHEVEILTLKESLRHAEEALISVRSELQEKISELEQSEHRVSSVREKLSIAVGKGKGLVVQRDGLKQSLVETSAELERCSQELQVKDSQLHELEIKLKAYSEAGERVEALESELSYIRNSATALRESFLLKDSVLQRIEEILEDLDLPEHFHSRDIIEKVDWLARSTTGNALPPNDWDQKSSVGGSHSDAGFVTVDNWKEDAQPSSILGEDLRRKYEDLQSKFYGLAEQNEMLEQSLMERNHLVQRWEELLDRIDMPSQLRSMEPEERIKWLGGALSEANFDRNSLQKKIDNLEDYSGSLSADLEESEKRIYVLEAGLQSVTLEREHLSERLESLTSDHHNLVAKAAHLELENEKLQTKVSGLQEEMVKRIEEGERLLKMEGDIERLLDLVGDVLQEQDSEAKDLVSVDGSTACLERLLKKLIENYTNLNSVNPEVVNIGMDQTKLVDPTHDEARSIDVTAQNDVISLKNELEESLQNLMQVKEERDGYFEKLQSLLHEVQALKRKREELQEQLNQEEQKSASVREKLNVAVRKGKSLVQQRDGLKKSVEEMNAELETLKSELRLREHVLADYELKIRDFSSCPERIEALEADNLFLRNHLTETERVLEEKGYILGRVLNTVANIDVGDEIDTSDPVERLGRIEKACHDLRAAVASAEQESRKSKRAAELLVAELNEVQERNDNLQEDVAKLASELTVVMKERDVAEAAKLEVLSRLEKLSTVHSERNRNQYSELMMLQSSVIELRKGFHDIHNLLSDASLKELEFLQHLEVNVKSYLEGNDAQDVAGFPYITSSNFGNKEDFPSMDTLSVSNMQDTDENPIVEVSILIRHHLRDVMAEMTALKEKLIVHSKSVHEQCHSVWNVLGILHRDRNYQKESFEAMRRNIIHIESIGKEKDLEILVLRRNIASLYEACAKSVLEVENRKDELLGNNLATADFRTDLKPVTLADGGLSFSGDTPFSEEYIKAMGDKLLSTMKEFSSLKAEIAEGSQREMKTTIANLRKELHEKDIQKDQICMELVDQIKSAEAAAANYSRDLQSSKKLVHDLESELEVMREEQKSLQQRLKELQDVQVNAVELQDRVKSLTDLLSSKDQEIEALMQALDEEEVQMEELTKKIEELEEVLQQKNTALENLEASRGKVMKKLSITMSKFDELHNLSEGLLAEIEQLQSQLQDRDAEISFLRQEVTRCTNDVLVASQMSSKQDLNEINEFLTWFEAIISRVGVSDLQFDAKNNQVHEYKELIKKKIISVISELEDLRGVAQSRDELLQAERSKVEELTHREETLKKTLHEKESQLNLLKDVEDVGLAASFNTEIVEVEPVINKWAVAGTSAKSQVRSLRKVNNDQVAIAIDADDGSNSRLEDEDEDKVHGFKSLTTSRVVPRFTRPISDMIDGLWVSCDRALMRQPALRLGIIIYWALLHTLLAAFVF